MIENDRGTCLFGQVKSLISLEHIDGEHIKTNSGEKEYVRCNRTDVGGSACRCVIEFIEGIPQSAHRFARHKDRKGNKYEDLCPEKNYSVHGIQRDLDKIASQYRLARNKTLE